MHLCKTRLPQRAGYEMPPGAACETRQLSTLFQTKSGPSRQALAPLLKPNGTSGTDAKFDAVLAYNGPRFSL